MCSKLAPSLKPGTTIRIRAKTTLRPPARKTRSKTRKPKYLSLRLELSQDSSSQMTSTTIPTSDHHQQLNLFPLHPENLVDQDRLLDTHDQDQNMMAASFFSSADDGAATTLTGLLSSTVTLTNSSDEDNLSPLSLNYGDYNSNEEGEHNELVRTAMRRNKERDRGGAEEKWVRYSEVVEEVSSSSACGKPRRCRNGNNRNTTAAAVAVVEEQKQRGLSLKLDYDEIMNAWCDKGPLYINHSNNDQKSAMDDQLDSPQTVPDLLLGHDHDDDFVPSSAAANNGLWRVPEMGEEETKGGGDREAAAAPPPWEYWEWKAGGGGVGQSSQREASVQRYKEKRQSRLFAKKIRYQVRKLNAEKRPRIKGRFVKRIS